MVVGKKRAVKVKTKGAQLLCERLDAAKARNGPGESDRLRQACCVSWGSWWAYRSGARRPSWSVMLALRTLLGIPTSAWLTEEERRAERDRTRSVKKAS